MSSRSYSQGGGGAAQQKQITHSLLPRTILGFKTPETDAFHEYLRNLAKKTDIYKHEFMFLSEEFGLSKQLITQIK